MPRISAWAKILQDLREIVDGRKQNSLFRQQYMAEFSDYDRDVAMVEDFIDAIVIDAEQQLSAKRYFFRKKVTGPEENCSTGKIPSIRKACILMMKSPYYFLCKPS